MQCFLGSLDAFPNAVNQCSELAQPDAVCCDKPIVVDEYIYVVVTASRLEQPDVSPTPEMTKFLLALWFLYWRNWTYLATTDQDP